MPLRSILGLNWGSQDGPGGGLYGASTEPFWCLGASWVPLGAKMAPRPLPKLIFLDFGAHLGGFWSPSDCEEQLTKH